MAVIPKRDVVNNIHDTISSGYINVFDNINNQSAVKTEAQGGTLVKNIGAENLLLLVRGGAGVAKFKLHSKTATISKYGRTQGREANYEHTLNDGQLVVLQVPEEYNDENGYYKITSNNADQIKIQVFRVNR